MNCAVVALAKLAELPMSVAQAEAEVAGLREDSPLNLWQTVKLLEWRLGQRKELRYAGKADRPTLSEFLERDGASGNWAVFLWEHVVPVVDGEATNGEGYGDEQLVVAVRFAKLS